MKLAELEAKAKALVGTQHWRGLDPEAVLTMCAKLAKTCAALKLMDCDCVLEMSPPEDHVKHDELCNYRIARQTLREIEE